MHGRDPATWIRNPRWTIHALPSPGMSRRHVRFPVTVRPWTLRARPQHCLTVYLQDVESRWAAQAARREGGWQVGGQGGLCSGTEARQGLETDPRAIWFLTHA